MGEIWGDFQVNFGHRISPFSRPFLRGENGARLWAKNSAHFFAQNKKWARFSCPLSTVKKTVAHNVCNFEEKRG